MEKPNGKNSKCNATKRRVKEDGCGSASSCPNHCQLSKIYSKQDYLLYAELSPIS